MCGSLRHTVLLRSSSLRFTRFPPRQASSAQFQYLYGARNDTEARHADLKSRIKYLPPDVAGQDLRMLGAMVTSNAVAWQAHLQAQEQPNVFDGTA